MNSSFYMSFSGGWSLGHQFMANFCVKYKFLFMDALKKSTRNYAEVPHNRCHMPRTRMTQRRNLFKNLHALRQLILWCSGYRVCLRRTSFRVRTRQRYIFSFFISSKKKFLCPGTDIPFFFLINLFLSRKLNALMGIQ